MFGFTDFGMLESYQSDAWPWTSSVWEEKAVIESKIEKGVERTPFY